MVQSRRIRPFAFRLAVLGIAATLLSILTVSQSNSVDAQDPLLQTQNLSPTVIYLQEGMELSPSFPEKEEASAVQIPDGYKGDGLFRLGIINKIGHTEWMDVGIWYSQDVRQKLFFGGRFTVEIWAYNEERSVNADFEFALHRATEATPLIVASVRGANIPQGMEGGRIMASADFPNTNDTSIEAGSQLELRIRARCNGGAILVFGSTHYPSRISLDSNMLQIHSIHVEEEKTSFEYKDAFLVPWVKMTRDMKINGFSLPPEKATSIMNTENRTREILWMRKNSPGQYEVEVTLTYDPEGLRNITMRAMITIEEREEDPFEWIKSAIFGSMRWIVFIIFMIILFFVLVRMRKNTWKRRFRTLPPTSDELSKRIKKKLWKKTKKERRNESRAVRHDLRKKKMEEAELERGGGFSLFRKPKRSPEPVMAEIAPIEELDFD